MNIVNARLRKQPGLYRIELDGERIAAITEQPALVAATANDLDAAGNLVTAPFIEPHIHLDATLTAGEPAWNMSGTLFEGIERWGERKALVTHEDTKQRARKTIDMLVDHGIQHVRTHVDVTDPTLAALKAMVEVRDEVRHLIDLQIVAFPQEGIESFANGRALMEQTVRLPPRLHTNWLVCLGYCDHCSGAGTPTRPARGADYSADGAVWLWLLHHRFYWLPWS